MAAVAAYAACGGEGVAAAPASPVPELPAPPPASAAAQPAVATATPPEERTEDPIAPDQQLPAAAIPALAVPAAAVDIGGAPQPPAATADPPMFERLEDLYPFGGDAEEVGSGNFGTVYKVRSRDGRVVAVKAFNQGVRLSTVKAEAKYLSKVQRHDHVLGYHGMFMCDHPGGFPGYALVLDYVPGNDLFHLVRMAGEGKSMKDPILSERAAHVVLRCLLMALAHVHGHGIVHRDVTPPNVLVRPNGEIALADFAVAAALRDGRRLRQRCGTPGFIAPEVIRREAYGCKVDVFSAGIVLYFTFAGGTPFFQAGDSVQDVLRKTLSSPLDLDRNAWMEASNSCRSMVRLLTRRQPQHRCSAEEALQHDWLHNEPWEPL